MMSPLVGAPGGDASWSFAFCAEEAAEFHNPFMVSRFTAIREHKSPSWFDAAAVFFFTQTPGLTKQDRHFILQDQGRPFFAYHHHRAVDDELLIRLDIQLKRHCF